jgi:polysaccharide export outer membrane protein
MTRLLYIIVLLSGIAGAYNIGPDDTLKVQVMEDPTYNQVVRVDAEGFAALPLIDKVNVKGLTPSDASLKIKNILIKKQFFINPNVSITVKTFDSQKVLVLGEVRFPGSYTLSSESTILDIITKAGGINPRGSRNIILIRKKKIIPKGASPDDKSDTIKTNIDYNAIIKGEKLEQNMVLQDGDVLHVKRSFF